MCHVTPPAWRLDAFRYDPVYVVARLDQQRDAVRADEAGCAGDEHAAHRGTPKSAQVRSRSLMTEGVDGQSMPNAGSSQRAPRAASG